jgi:tRNA(adenine34) deaminase
VDKNSAFLDEMFMNEALRLAEEAASRREVPVGAVIVLNGQIIGRGANCREGSNDPTTHAEISAIREAANHMGDWRLEKSSIYVTLEPCPMCAGAIVNARIPRVVYGCADPKAGAVRSLYQLLEDPRLNHRSEVIPGILADRAAKLLRTFFAELRSRE